MVSEPSIRDALNKNTQFAEEVKTNDNYDRLEAKQML